MELAATLGALGEPLLRYCLARTGCPDLAQDVAQEASRALVDRWRRLGPPDDPMAFLCAVARRRAGHHQARAKIFRPLLALPSWTTSEPGPEEQASRRGELEAALKALRKLGRKDRQVLELVALAELDLKAAAVVLGISPAAAKMRLHRARRRLTERLETTHERA
jgi:RNA polymerase sigma-70 factor (ECF subfamily)